MEDLKSLVEKKSLIDRDIKKYSLLIHQVESGNRHPKSVVKIAKKRQRIHTLGTNYGALVSVFMYKSSGKDKIKITILIKRYDMWKGNCFFFGESSITLNQSELNELISYASKIFESQGVNLVAEQPTLLIDDDDTDDDDDDFVIDGVDSDEIKKERKTKTKQKRKLGKKVRKERKRKPRNESSSDDDITDHYESDDDDDVDDDDNNDSDKESRKRIKKKRNTKCQ